MRQASSATGFGTWTICTACILAALFLCAAGCETREMLARDQANIEQTIAEAEAMGAKVCAPREFAAAEANLDFAKNEWNERHYVKSRDHLLVAHANAQRAKDLSVNCIEKQPPDSDGDTIHDGMDLCVNQPEDFDGFEDEDGCPDPDNDADGIPDADDKCPNQAETVNDFQDQDGCPDYKKIEVTKEQIFLKEQVHFETGKATIMIDSYAILDEVFQALTDNPGIRIRIEGHTDSQGAEEYNQELSESRANSVMEYLVRKGIDPVRMMAQGFGEMRPIDTNKTAKGRAKNRRVEIHILK